MSTLNEILYHHGTTDPTDFQVDDILVCIAAAEGLEVGELYRVLALTRGRTRIGVVTTVIVSANLKLIEVIDAESFLRRTHVLAEVTAPDGQVKTHCFPDEDDLEVWCAVTRVTPDRIRGMRYVQADAAPPTNYRFTAMCVPGDLDDGSDTNWYVYDLLSRTSDKVGAGPSSRALAIRTAREANRAPRCREGANDE